ncbi:MAG: hypothetical protein IH586_03885 [Anaerolineaceae bacterium]|nr:hypothetical protein [Anaerolineaceae bacterium]
MNNLSPRLAFFCELPSGPLETLFADPQVIDFLVETRSAVGLGIIDLSDQRAGVVKQLNEAGIPVNAWLLLPKDKGYWFNLDNGANALERYDAFREWTERHGLRWARIGLDIEPDIRALQGISKQRWAGLPALMKPIFDANRLKRGTQTYHQLIKRIHNDGYVVEAYHFPFILDERGARSSALQRLTGLVDLPEADYEAFMLYSSFLRPWGPGMLWSYGPQAEIIAVGSTGGGVTLDGILDIRPLNWNELQADLLLANQHTTDIYIFSLEGCVEQNFLPLLRSIDWTQPAHIPYRAAQRVDDMRKTFQRGLWLLARPAWILFGLAMLVSVLTLLSRRKR